MVWYENFLKTIHNSPVSETKISIPRKTKENTIIMMILMLKIDNGAFPRILHVWNSENYSEGISYLFTMFV